MSLKGVHDMQVKYKFFKATLKSWDSMHAEAAEFATMIGKDRLINISHSSDHSEGVITVWYWSE